MARASIIRVSDWMSFDMVFATLENVQTMYTDKGLLTISVMYVVVLVKA